jgi:hypothetical protein
MPQHRAKMTTAQVERMLYITVIDGPLPPRLAARPSARPTVVAAPVQPPRPAPPKPPPPPPTVLQSEATARARKRRGIAAPPVVPAEPIPPVTRH